MKLDELIETLKRYKAVHGGNIEVGRIVESDIQGYTEFRFSKKITISAFNPKALHPKLVIE